MRRVTGIVIGVGLAAGAAVAMALRYVPIPGHLTLVAVIASPFALLAAPFALLVLAFGRHWILAGVAAILTVVVVVVQLPSYLATTPDPSSVAVRVMSINMLYGHADPEAVTRTAVARADVVMAQELTPAAVAGLAKAGVMKDFPYQILEPRPDAAGVGIYSRYPIEDPARLRGLQMASVSARLRIDGVSRPVSVASVHFAAPWPQTIDGWHADLTAFPRIMSDLATEAADGSVVIGGDFNATVDMRPFRELLTDGYRDSAQQAGDGRNFTYPANRGFPPLLGIDHVLTRNAVATSTSTDELPGSDHRALIVTLAIPRG